MTLLITSSKFIGVALLGLFAGKLFVHVYETIPSLISSLSHQVTLKSTHSGLGITDRILDALADFTIFTNSLTAVSTTLLLVAYFVASPVGRHPYLLYAAAAAPVAVIVQNYIGNSAALQLNDKLTVLQKFESEGGNANIRAASNAADELAKVEASEHSDEDSLARSYIHVSDEEEGSSSSLTPSDGSPLVAADELQQEISIEEEIQIVLLKKELAQNLQELRTAYIWEASVAGFGFLVATVGIVGEYFIV